MSEDANSTRASFTALSGEHQDEVVDVHFNPTSLKYTLKNTLKKGNGDSTKQKVSQSTAQLSMELVFDSTDDGQDVRADTRTFLKFMQPDNEKFPPVVMFEWGAFAFQGMVESFNETIDFFAPTGVPLRSTVSITLSSQDKVFSEAEEPDNPEDGEVEVPPSPNWDSSSMASRGGDDRAARGIARSNNQESMRFSSGPSLRANSSIELSPPAAFASGGISGGLGLSAGAGLSGGAGLDVGAGGSLSAGISIGGSASAGVSASQGAFAGLRAAAPSPRLSAKFDAGKLIQRSDSVFLSTDSNAAFSLGGQATLQGSVSLSADVGASADLKARIQFDEV